MSQLVSRRGGGGALSFAPHRLGLAPLGNMIEGRRRERQAHDFCRPRGSRLQTSPELACRRRLGAPVPPLHIQARELAARGELAICPLGSPPGESTGSITITMTISYSFSFSLSFSLSIDRAPNGACACWACQANRDANATMSDRAPYATNAAWPESSTKGQPGVEPQPTEDWADFGGGSWPP